MMATELTLDFDQFQELISGCASRDRALAEWAIHWFDGCFGAEVVDGCLVPDPAVWYARDDSGYEMEMEGCEDAEGAAQAYVDGGDWNQEEQTGTSWVTVRGYLKGIDCDGDECCVSEFQDDIAIEQPEPNCLDGENHDWQSPYSIVGGIKENPGVWGHGGGVIIKEVCMLCGCQKVTDTWAQNPSNGQQGLTSVKYTEGEYTEQVNARLVRKAKENLEADEDTLSEKVEGGGYDQDDIDSYSIVWVDEDGDLVGCDDDELLEYGVRLQVEGDEAKKPHGTAISFSE
jgi:hypothetical protein